MTHDGIMGKNLEQKREFEQRRKKFESMPEKELENRFWTLLDRIVDPLVRLSHDYTSPSVERSVLLRMGFNSLDAGEIVEGCEKRGLLGKGAGHVVLKLARANDTDIKTIGKGLIEGKYWEQALKLFGGEKVSVSIRDQHD